MSSSRSSAGRRGHPARAATWLLTVAAENAGGAVYGAVMIGVLLAAEDARREDYPETIGAAAVVLVLYWLTSFYTHTLGARLSRREPLSRSALWHGCVHELPIIEGAVIPVLALLVAWAAGATVSSGVTAALWATIITIVALEVAAGLRAHLRPQGLCLQAAAGVFTGLAIIALKVVLH